jgi:hypothetical protein
MFGPKRAGTSYRSHDLLNSMQGVVELKTLRAHPIPHGAELTALIQTTGTSEYRAAHKHGGIELAL